MKPMPLIGSLVSCGVEPLRAFQRLKLGDVVLTQIPFDKAEALSVARYCREHRIHLCLWEFLLRGGFHPRGPKAAPLDRSAFYSKRDVEEIFDAAGDYYLGRMTIGEIGTVLYCPRAYEAEWRGTYWQNLPPVERMDQARRAYESYVRKFLDFERKEIGRGPLMNVESGLTFKYQAEGLDSLCLEAMPGDPHLMHAAIRGTARAFGKPWGTHVAMFCYGGFHVGPVWQKRWKLSLLYPYLSGAEFIWSENEPYAYNQNNRQVFKFNSPAMKEYRRTLRETYQFARVHTRPSGGPLVRFGVLYGNDDGTPGLWNRAVWSQYSDPKWLEGPPERGWRFVDKFHRQEDWPRESVQGNLDFSGNPPYGTYDVVPIEASLKTLRSYSSLVCLGWNTMTPDIYRNLTDYVRSGGKLVMFLPQLSTQPDRAKDLKLFRNGDLRDLFGVRVLGKGTAAIRGIKCFDDSILKSWRFPRWRISTDPRYMGRFTPARMKLEGARIICGHTDHYRTPLEELQRQPVLVEHRVGKGVAFLVGIWEYPADEGLSRFTDDVLRTMLQGEQGRIRLLSTDRVRYAVYRQGGATACEVIYLLNTSADTPASARLWVNGRLSDLFTIPPAELRVAYLRQGCLVLPSEKRVDLAAWNASAQRHDVSFFSVCDQDVDIHHVGRSPFLRVVLNGKAARIARGTCARLRLARRIDPTRRAFFAPDFLEEPRVRVTRNNAFQ